MRRGGRKQSVYVEAEACKTNVRFIFLGRRELVLRGDGGREREGRAGYDWKAIIFSQISLC